MKNKTVLVTGACGEIGTALIKKLKSLNYNVIAIDVRNIDPKYAKDIDVFKRIDILDTAKIIKIISDYKVSSIFHLAAILSTSAEKDPVLAHKVNVEGTLNLLNAAKSYSDKNNLPIKFIFPSSIAAYGMPSVKVKNEVKKVKETEYNNPRTIYGINKLYCEHLGRYYSLYYQQKPTNIDFRCIRFPGIISALTLPTGGTSDYAPEMIHAAVKGKKYHCFVTPSTTIPFMAMPDAVDAIVSLFQQNKNIIRNFVYNISGFSLSAKEIEKKIVKVFPKFKVVYEPDLQRQQIVDSWPADLDDSLAKKDWNWKPILTADKAFYEYLIPTIRELN